MEDLAIYLDGATTTQLAVSLDIAMACDDAARARYLAIYGVEWSSLSDDALVGCGARSNGPTTTAKTLR